MITNRKYGPAAALSRSKLNEEQRELFDWFTDKITDKDTVLYSSLLQKLACDYPNVQYWQAIKALKVLITPKLLAELKGPALEEARANLSKPLD